MIDNNIIKGNFAFMPFLLMILLITDTIQRHLHLV